MSAEHERAIAQIKEQIQKAQQIKYKAEARMEQLKQNRAELLGELEALGVTPEGLDAEIKRLQEEVTTLLREAAAMLPADLLRG